MASSPSEPAAKLYTPTLLALSVELAGYPLDADAPCQGRAKSRTCGSEVLLSCAPGPDGAVRSLGMQVTACAVGQASAAIFADQVTGRPRDEIERLTHALEGWLTEGGSPDFLPRLELLEPARTYPARHEAILLPWRAALDALA